MHHTDNKKNHDIVVLEHLPLCVCVTAFVSVCAERRGLAKDLQQAEAHCQASIPFEIIDYDS